MTCFIKLLPLLRVEQGGQGDCCDNPGKRRWCQDPMVATGVTIRGWIVFTFLKAEQRFVETVSEGCEGKRGAHDH